MFKQKVIFKYFVFAGIVLLMSCKCKLWNESFEDSMERNSSYLLVLVESSPVLLDKLPETIKKPDWYETAIKKGHKFMAFRFQSIEFLYNDTFAKYQLPSDTAMGYKALKVNYLFSKYKTCYIPICSKYDNLKIERAFKKKQLVYLLNPEIRDFDNALSLFSKTFFFNDAELSSRLH